MNLADIIFYGWYQILDKIIYSYGNEQESIGPKEHSFFITFLVHGINVWTVLRYLSIEYFSSSIPLYVSLFLCILIFVIGYLFYFRGNRANRIISHNVEKLKIVLFVVVAIVYTIISVYFMLEVGNYVRHQLSARSI